MKYKYLLFILSLNFFSSCKNEDLKVKIVDTACINGQKRAISDINAGKLYYFHSNVLYEWEEMAKLLSTYNIEFKDNISSCIAPLSDFKYDCYEQVMWSEIDKKIGKSTIDSLWKIAERNFVLKYPDSVYIKDGIDIRKKYFNTSD